jgi:hypothetical protein
VSIVNRRNAVLGWGVWKLGKRVVRRKAPPKGGPPTKSLVAAGLAGAVGALTFWRKRSSSGDES